MEENKLNIISQNKIYKARDASRAAMADILDQIEGQADDGGRFEHFLETIIYMSIDSLCYKSPNQWESDPELAAQLFKRLIPQIQCYHRIGLRIQEKSQKFIDYLNNIEKELK